ncbi:HAD-like protein [Violaceomyces palustris]|uniref:HAD-like protein n=1 Tax=Violaceomyces palustris TaxID=1673888 RepID=A0ACD0NS09_9BASI|nr:HAD-like protein [Violaceomyces palustris]
MDGLLIDSEGIYTKVVNDILRPYGKEQTWAIKANLMGKPEREATYTLLSSLWPPSPDHPELQFSPDCPFTIDTFLADRNLNLEEEFSKVPPMPGAQRLVEHLERCGVPICVATGSKRRNFEIKTAHNGPLFSPFRDRIICGDDSRLSRGKPNPDVFLLAAREGLFAGEREGSETHQKLGSGWVDSIRELGEENDSKGFKGGEAQVLVFEDAKVGFGR